MEKIRNKKICLLFIVYFLGMYGFNMAHVVTPKFISDYYPKNSINTGALYAVMSLGSTLSMPIWGNLTDRIGRKKVLFITIFIYAFFQMGFGLSKGNMTSLIICRLLAGLIGGQAFRVAARSYITDITTIKARTGAMATLILFDSLSMESAYLSMGGVNHWINTMIPNQKHAWMIMLVQGVFCIIVSIIILLTIKENVWKTDGNQVRSFNVFKNIASDFKKVRGTGLIVLLLMTIPATLTRTSSKMVDVYLTNPNFLGHTPLFLGMIYAGIGTSSAIFVFLIFPKIKKYLEDMRWMLVFGLFSAFALALGWTLPHFIKNLHFFPYVYIMQSLFDMTNQIFIALIISYISKMFDKNHGAVMGLTNIAFTFGSIIGPLSLNFLLLDPSVGTYIFDIVAGCSIITAVSIYFYTKKLSLRQQINNLDNIDSLEIETDKI